MDIYSQPNLRHFITLKNFVGQLSARSMFGCFGIFKSEIMIGMIDQQGVFYIRATDNKDLLEQQGFQAYTYAKKNQNVTTQYYALPKYLTDNTAEFVGLINQTHDKIIELNNERVKRLSEYPNITPNIERRLHQVGITTMLKLKEVGACEAYLKLRHNFKCPYSTLFLLESAIRGIHVQVLPQAEKVQLEQQLKQCA
ncbi:TfoX/Sxy family DNA transformation protein [Vibrio parahaemolyticus]|nr:TfoX/Sxy family DNA transformation protein [Vibrio parahaemolyticus]